MRFSMLFFFILFLVFTACQSPVPNRVLTDAQKEEYLKNGKTITLVSGSALIAKLQKALAEKGVPGALQYCKVAALPIVDSLSAAHNVSIRRTSLKYRNPEDKPTETEALMLKAFQQQLLAGAELIPVVQAINQKEVAFYAPIRMMEFCLPCHGQIGEDIAPEHHDLIRQLYPDDLATGYKTGDLRGMWSITFRD